jgi:hypothetical protein
MLLVFAPVMLDLTEGVFEVAGFKRIELGSPTTYEAVVNLQL